MAQATLVMKQIEDGETLLKHLQVNHFDVIAACWLNDVEGDEWSFYIASKVVDQKGLFEAYKDLHNTLSELPDLWINPLEVKLIGANHPVANAIVDLHRRFPAKIHTRYRLKELGGIPIDEAHIYPPIP